MPTGPKKHLKRINAPSHWMLDKLGGVFAPRPSPGPHKLRECLPLVILLRNRLKYALTGREVTKILMQRVVKVDGKVRTDHTYPAGFQDVVQIEKTKENFRLLYTPKGKFTLHKIPAEETGYKLLKVRKVTVGIKGIPFLATHDGRTIRYPHPEIKANDTVKFNLATGKVDEVIKFQPGNLLMIVGGRNLGRVGTLKSVEKHDGSHTIIHVEDLAKKSFATRLENAFVLGEGKKALISLPRGAGIKLSPLEQAAQIQAKRKAKAATVPK